MATDLDHLMVAGFTSSKPFQSALRVIPPPPPQRERVPHGRRLLRQIDLMVGREDRLRKDRRREQLPGELGSAITLQVVHGHLDVAVLEWKKDRIEVLTVQNVGNFDFVTLYVPEGKLAALRKRVEAYLNEQTPSQKPKNQPLITAIESIGPAAFQHMWTDDPENLPNDGDYRLFQLWLRVENGEPTRTASRFSTLAVRLGIDVIPGHLRFPGRVVVAARTTRRQLEKAIELLDLVAEIRETRPTAKFFLDDLQPDQRAAFINDLRSRLVVPSENDDTYITVLDTGVNRHPLLRDLLAINDRHAVIEEWTNEDDNGHGSQMAGIAVYGDLAEALASDDPVEATAFLESVKIIDDNDPHPPHLFGRVTEIAADRVEAVNPGRRRTFSMAISETGRTLGFPSDWSAAVDRLAFGLPTSDGAGDVPDEDIQQEQPRLFVVSAGNVSTDLWSNYPDSNTLEAIESPGQAWNALTVGAATRLVQFDEKKWADLRRIAAEGGLSPSSRTSRMWNPRWPIKPEVVEEGGNGCIDTVFDTGVDGPSELRLLTTSNDVLTAPLTETGDTSAACASVSRLTTRVASRYRNYWPETVRGLVVHGANWTPHMLAALGKKPKAKEKYSVLRAFGYGMVSPSRTLASASNRATLILQRELIPFVRRGGHVGLGNMDMHALPWPKGELSALHEARIRMNVTLSYFVEPNPSQRGWQSKFRYQSHALRFAVKGSTETDDEFSARISPANLDIEGDEDSDDTNEANSGGGDPDVANWVIGPQVRSRGSLHRDIWQGTAAQLAEKSHIAVFPVGGWWKDTGRHSKNVRYSLIVSLEVLGDVEVDIYTPIETAISVPVPTP